MNLLLEHDLEGPIPGTLRAYGGIAYSAGRFDLGDMYHAWADELHAATKGEE